MGRLPARIVVAALAVSVSFAARSNAQDPALDVLYKKMEPKEPFKYKWKGQEATVNAGVFRWEVPESAFGTDGLDRNFTGYCAEVLVPIVADKTYRFRKNSIYEPSNYGLAEHKDGPTAATRRARYIQELFGRYFRDPNGKNAVNAEEAVAFQVALWEVIQETEPAEGETKRDLFAGDFQANYPKADAPAFVTRAQGYLDSLTGDDALYYENPDLRGRELIRLMGVENAEKVVAQSQFALRYTGGGAAGGEPLAQLSAGGGAIGAAGGVPLGGVAGAPGGGGGGIATTGGSGDNGSPIPPTVTPNTNPPVSGTPPVNPPTVNTDGPPVGGPDEPTPNPVPAPAGVLLGAVALGTLGSWRVGVKLLSAK